MIPAFVLLFVLLLFVAVGLIAAAMVIANGLINDRENDR